jgi:hypothetical protein
MNAQLVSRIKSFRGPQEKKLPAQRRQTSHDVHSSPYIRRGFAIVGKPVCELGITLVASSLPTICGLPLAKRAGFA